MLFKSNSSETGVGTCLIFSHHPTKKGIHFLQQIVVQVVWIKNCKFLDLFSKFKSSHLVRWFPTNKFIYREFPIFSQVFPMISREILRPPPSSRGFHPASAARRGRRSWKPAVVTTAVVTGNSENHGENHIIYKFQCLLPHVVRYFAIIYIYIHTTDTVVHSPSMLGVCEMVLASAACSPGRNLSTCPGECRYRRDFIVI